MKAILKKQWVSAILVIALAVAFSFYYFMLRRAVWSDPERSYCMYFMALPDKFGIPFKLGQINLQIVATWIGYKIAGFTMLGEAIEGTVRYFFICIPVLFLTIYKRDTKNIRWYIVPFVFFMFGLINMNSTPANGTYSLVCFHQVFYEQHTDAYAWALVGFWALDSFLKNEGRAKKVSAVMLVMALLLGLHNRDLLFIVIFVVPLMIGALIILWKKNNIKLVGWLLCLGIGVVAATRVLGILGLVDISALEALRGNEEFEPADNIWYAILRMVDQINAIFGVELDTIRIISLNTVVAVLRMICVLGVFIAIGWNIRRLLTWKNGTPVNYDLASTLMAIGILDVLIWVAITDWGQSNTAGRYDIVAFFFGIPILVRLINEMYDNALLLHQKKTYRQIIFLFMGLAVLLDIKPFWEIRDDDHVWKPGHEQIAKVIMEENLGNGIGNFWAASTVTALMGGENYIFPCDISDEGIVFNEYFGDYKEEYGEIHYIMTGTGGESYFGDLFYWPKVSHIYNAFGEPDRFYITDLFYIYYYEDPLFG